MALTLSLWYPDGTKIWMGSIVKKILFWGLILHTALVFSGDYPCVHFMIRIQNNTQSSCFLTKIKLLAGHVTNVNDLPLEIPAGQSTDPFDVSEWGTQMSDIVLTYRCGDGQFVKFESQKDLCRRNAQVVGSVISALKMDATYTGTDGLYWDNKPGTISWTLSDLP